MASEDHFQLQSELIERGVVWQVAGFAIVGIAATAALAIYSETDTLSFRFFEVATTKINWAFVPAVAFIADRSRRVFERRSEIRAAARREVHEKWRREENERIQSELEAEGVVIPPEIAERVFNHKNGEES